MLHFLVVYVKEALPLALSLKKHSVVVIYVFGWLHFNQYFFFLYRSSSSDLCTVIDALSLSIDKALSIVCFADVFGFRNINIYHKD